MQSLWAEIASFCMFGNTDKALTLVGNAEDGHQDTAVIPSVQHQEGFLLLPPKVCVSTTESEQGVELQSQEGGCSQPRAWGVYFWERNLSTLFNALLIWPQKIPGSSCARRGAQGPLWGHHQLWGAYVQSTVLILAHQCGFSPHCDDQAHKRGSWFTTRGKNNLNIAWMLGPEIYDFISPFLLCFLLMRNHLCFRLW